MLSQSLLAFIMGFVMLFMATAEVVRPSANYSLAVVHAFISLIVYVAGVRLSNQKSALQS